MSTESTPSRRPDLPALTSLRFFAALWVAFFHIEVLGLAQHGFAWYRALSQIGYAGVSFFFVLSGFILVYVYSGREMPKLRFLQARFARIYPAYFFALIVTLPGFLNNIPYLRHIHRAILALISYPLLLQAWFPSILLVWNPVAWSLSVELIFYLLFPFILPRLDKLNIRGILVWIGSSWLASLLITGSYVFLRPDGVAHATSLDNDLFWLGVVKLNPLARLPEFLLGMGFGALFLRARPRVRTWPILAGATAIAAVVALRSAIPYPVLHTGLLALAFGLIIFGFATRPPTGLLASPPLILLGEASYSFYLLHTAPLLVLVFGYHVASSPHLRWIVAAYLIGTTLFAIAVFHVIENPMRRLLRPRRTS
jgi:peptidoglycan/LPS O-acetylase OafA/YrhL